MKFEYDFQHNYFLTNRTTCLIVYLSNQNEGRKWKRFSTATFTFILAPTHSAKDVERFGYTVKIESGSFAESLF